jgi:hypothetical protein
VQAAVRRFAWWAFLVTEGGLVAASAAYVGVGTRAFWLVAAAAVIAVIGFAVTVRVTREPTLDETGAARERWYWF